MKLYCHEWLDADTKRAYKSERIANSIEDAIDDYHQDDFMDAYVDTVVVDDQNGNCERIDIKDEIERQKLSEMSTGERADYMGLTIQQVERVESKNY